MLKWISETEELPPVAQPVLLLSPRQFDELWDMHVARLLIQHEDVIPRPVPKGTQWPTTYYWGTGQGGKDTHLITGNSWWASYRDLPLPLGAEHRADREFDYIAKASDGQMPG